MLEDLIIWYFYFSNYGFGCVWVCWCLYFENIGTEEEEDQGQQGEEGIRIIQHRNRK